jgi:hypothetical protein
MAIAGFYAVHNSEIRFARDGNWYADGELVDNPRISRLFANSIERDGVGGYRLRIGDETAPVVVEDTPYVVTSVDVDGDGELVVSLNDGSTEIVPAGGIALGDGDVFYCDVKGGRDRARLLRPAHYQLAAHVEPDPSGGFRLRLGERVLPLRRR